MPIVFGFASAKAYADRPAADAAQFKSAFEGRCQWTANAIATNPATATMAAGKNACADSIT